MDKSIQTASGEVGGVKRSVSRGCKSARERIEASLLSDLNSQNNSFDFLQDTSVSIHLEKVLLFWLEGIE